MLQELQLMKLHHTYKNLKSYTQSKTLRTTSVSFIQAKQVVKIRMNDFYHKCENNNFVSFISCESNSLSRLSLAAEEKKMKYF